MKQSLTILTQEAEDPKTTAQRRLQIGKMLEEIGDSRRGIGVLNGEPDIVWLPVAPGGNIKITRHWQPETPEEKETFIHIGPFRVEPFYIAKYLVTYAQYQAFVEDENGYNNLTWWRGMPEGFQPQLLDKQRTNQQNNPRTNVSWYQSVAFARWLTYRLKGQELPNPAGQGTFRVGDHVEVRLPTEWEWQWAAQNGAEARPYPWGEAKEGHANTAESGLNQATAVGLYPHGAAACGALDMAGNVMEWCANDKAKPEVIDVASTANKVLRGGDWGFGLENARCAYCDDEEPGCIDPLNGFRLVLGVKHNQ